jgi:orotate phosphoribosyltransferase
MSQGLDAIQAQLGGRTIRQALADFAALRAGKPPPAPDAAPTLDPWTYITTARLVADAMELHRQLPADVDMVAAIPRSGLVPGALIAYQRHLPLATCSRQFGLSEIGHGIRLEGHDGAAPRHILLIDDTSATGQELAACAAIVRTSCPEARITRAVVYCHPQAAAAVDQYVFIYPGLHFLEWNWPNAGHGSSAAYDFDGLLCEDFTAVECATPEAYRAAMPGKKPLFLPKRKPIPLIVTARPEATRLATMEWLARHGVTVEQLVMRDFPDPPAGDWARTMAEFKACHFERSGCLLFAESEPAQAEIIAARTGKLVLCPAAARLWPPRPANPNPQRQRWKAKAAACRHHTAAGRCGCAGTCAAQASKRVDLAECGACRIVAQEDEAATPTAPTSPTNLPPDRGGETPAPNWPHMRTYHRSPSGFGPWNQNG